MGEHRGSGGYQSGQIKWGILEWGMEWGDIVASLGVGNTEVGDDGVGT